MIEFTSRDETASLTYVDWQNIYCTEKPYQIFSAVAASDLLGTTTTNLVFKDGPDECIHDVRGSESAFSLDSQGFAFCQHKMREAGFEDSDHIETKYLPEMEALLRREVACVDKVYFFDWRVV